MANQEHLELLLQGPQPWNEWREAHPEISPDLRHADLQNADLSGVDLSHAMLMGANLHQARLRGSRLRAANLRRADLREANFQNADLYRAILAEADLRDANLKQADVREADLREARLPGAVLQGADLKGAVLSKEGFRYATKHNEQVGSSTARVFEPQEKAGSSVSRRRLMLSVSLGVLLVILAAVSAYRRASTGAQPAGQLIAGDGVGDTIELRGDALIVRSGTGEILSGKYLELLKSACRTIQTMQPPAKGLKEIQIANQSGEHGWIYTAPEKCGEITNDSVGRAGLLIAIYTKPIHKP